MDSLQPTYLYNSSHPLPPIPGTPEARNLTPEPLNITKRNRARSHRTRNPNYYIKNDSQNSGQNAAPVLTTSPYPQPFSTFQRSNSISPCHSLTSLSSSTDSLLSSNNSNNSNRSASPASTAASSIPNSPIARTMSLAASPFEYTSYMSSSPTTTSSTRYSNSPPPSCLATIIPWNSDGERPILRRKSRPKDSETLRSLRKKESEECLRRAYDLRTWAYLDGVLA